MAHTIFFGSDKFLGFSEPELMATMHRVEVGSQSFWVSETGVIAITLLGNVSIDNLQKMVVKASAWISARTLYKKQLNSGDSA